MFVPLRCIGTEPMDFSQALRRFTIIDDDGNDVARTLSPELALIQCVLEFTLEVACLGDTGRGQKHEDEVRPFDCIIDFSLPVISRKKLLLIKPRENAVLKQARGEISNEPRILLRV